MRLFQESKLLARPFWLCPAIFFYLLIINLSFIRNPPYWDSLLGPFAEAIWLKNNHFDYVRLWSKEPEYNEGGPVVYRHSLLPTIYAGLLSVLAPPAAFLVLHLFGYACAALVFFLFFLILRQHLPPPLALLWCMVATVEPVWSGQTAAISMEIPMMAAVAAVIYYLHQSRFRTAGLLGCLGLLIKETSLILALALAIWGLAKTFSRKLGRPEPDEMANEKGLPYLFLPLFCFIILKLIFGFHLIFPPGMFVNNTLLGRIAKFPAKSLVLYPSLLVELLVIAAIIGGAVYVHRRNLSAALNDRKTWLMGFLALNIFGFWAGSILFQVSLVRYFTFVVFPMAAFLALGLKKQWSVILALAVLAFGALNQYGAWMPPVQTRSGQILERSREYLIDLAGDREICRLLETEHFTDPIAGKFPFVQMLTLPELGYVSRALPNVFALNIVPSYAPVKGLEVGATLPHETLFIYAANVFELSWPPSLAPPPNAVEVAVDRRLPEPIVVWRQP